MTRVAVLAAIAMVATSPLATIARAPGKGTVILLDSNVPELDDEFTSFFAETLRSRGVRVVDPSSVQLTYHERASIVAVVFDSMAAVSESRVAWIETKYGAPQALFARVRINVTSLPYGEFTVHQVRSVCSFRCMDVRTHEVIKAGRTNAERRGEDLEHVQGLAANDAIISSARAAAASLR